MDKKISIDEDSLHYLDFVVAKRLVASGEPVNNKTVAMLRKKWINDWADGVFREWQEEENKKSQD